MNLCVFERFATRSATRAVGRPTAADKRRCCRCESGAPPPPRGRRITRGGRERGRRRTRGRKARVSDAKMNAVAGDDSHPFFPFFHHKVTPQKQSNFTRHKSAAPARGWEVLWAFVVRNGMELHQRGNTTAGPWINGKLYYKRIVFFTNSG